MSSFSYRYPGRRVLDQTVYLNGIWKTQKVNPLKLEPVITNKLKICTYNIWFGNERQQLRMQHLLKIIQDNDVDIFCFQEVTQTLLQYILSNPFVQKYHITGITQNDIGAYGNVIFSRFPLSKVYINHYKITGMQRKLVAADVIINNELFRFGTVHLESLAPGASKRVVQLKESIQFMLDKQKSFIRPQHLMIMGDFNECGTKHKKVLSIKDKQFIDSWSEYHGGDTKYENKYPGWTMPETDYFPPWRPDRLCYAFNYDYTEIDTRIKAKEEANGSLDSDDNGNDDIVEQKTFDFKVDETEVENNEDEKKEDFKYVMKGAKGEWLLRNIKKVGMDKIPLTETEKLNGDRITVFTPSDHYGLIAEFVCVDTEIEELNDIVKSRKLDSSNCIVM